MKNFRSKYRLKNMIDFSQGYMNVHFDPRLLIFLLPHYPAEAEHGHIHRDEDYGDQKADQQDQRRFEQRPHALDPVFEFFGEHLALAAEHFGQAVGFFAHAYEGGKFWVVKPRELRDARRERFALLQPPADGSERLPVGIEPDHVGKHPHACEQRHSRGGEQVKQFAKLRLVIFTDNRTRNGQVQ